MESEEKKTVEATASKVKADKVNSAEQDDYVFLMGKSRSGWLLDSGAT